MADFTVMITARCERELKKLIKSHPDLNDIYRRVLVVLQSDPYNRSRAHAIKKLEDVAAGAGQWRVRSGRFRFRYDTEERVVYLKSCSLRREDTY